MHFLPKKLNRTPRRLRCESLEDRRLLAFGILQETGNFVVEVERLKELAFEKDSNAYVAPNATELADFQSLAANLLSGNLQTAAQQASALDYEIVEFTDTDSGATLYTLREELVGGLQTRGWGSYFVNLQYHSDTLVEVPQPLFDTNAWDIGAKAFLQSKARGFLLAGAHRNANGAGTADVAHLSSSVFQTVHEAWNGPNGETTPWQIHGFSMANHDGDPGEDEFPAGTDLVTSAGDGDVTAAMLDLDSRFGEQGFLGYAYNTLDANDATNLEINDGVDGTTFSSLAASTNVQGLHSSGIGGDFLHVELEQSIRFDAVNRDSAAALISDSLSSALTFHVTGFQLASDNTQLTLDFSDVVDLSTLTAEDLHIDGLTTAVSVQLIDADTALFNLPALADGSHSINLAADAVDSLGQIGVNDFHLFIEVTANPPPGSGTKFFVVDTAGDQTYEYDADGDLIESYSLASGNTMPRGAASNLAGDTVWVIDNDDFVYVYDADGGLLGNWKANGLSRPEGIATDGIDVWIVDRGTDRAYLYDGAASHRSGNFDATSSFGLASGNKNPRGITTDGVSLWVVNWATSSDKVYKYSVDGTFKGSWILDSDNDSPRGITIDPSNPSNLWVVDNGTDAIYQYLGGGDRTSGTQDADAVFMLLGSNPQGIADPLPVGDEEQNAEPEATSNDLLFPHNRWINDDLWMFHDNDENEDDENDEEDGKREKAKRTRPDKGVWADF